MNPDPPGHAAQGTVPTSSRGPTLTLVVDDDAQWRDALRSWLERDGFGTVMLARADWVVAAVELHRPDVVVLDVNLPDGNGLDVLENLGRRWPELPVIITTAFGGVGTADCARRRGAAAYLEKPFRVATLLDEIRRVRSQGGGDDALAAHV
jgi:DNA-binding NtrC family response regulator